METFLERPVVVTTSHRGVFFGYTDGYSSGDVIIHLKNARNILVWPIENHGFLGLSVDGPKKGSRVGPAVSKLELRDITSVTDCSEEAVKAWEKEPWSIL